MIRRLVLPTLLILLTAQVACSRQEMAERKFYPMGGIPFVVKAYNVPESLFNETVDSIEEETAGLEQILSKHREDGEVAVINQQGSGPASQELVRLVRLASRLSAETDGAFDITVGPLISLWNHCAAEGRWPSDDEIRQRLDMVDWRQVVSSSRGTITLKHKNMSIDLGGIAKGFIADQAALKLKSQGVKRGIVDAGGDLVLFNSVGEEPFRIGVKNPNQPEALFAVINIDSGAVVTSGCYERYVVVQDKRVCHIVDPRTGMPVEELASVTIVAEEAATADAIATAVMVLGIEKGQALINSLPGVEGFLLWQKQSSLEWWISAGLQGKVRIL